MRLTQTQGSTSHHYGTQEPPPPYNEALSMPPPYMPNVSHKPNNAPGSNIYPNSSGPYPAGPAPNAYVSAPPPLQFPPLPQPPPQTHTIHTTTIIAPTGNCAYCLNGQIVNETDICCLLCLILLAIFTFPVGCILISNSFSSAWSYSVAYRVRSDNDATVAVD